MNCVIIGVLINEYKLGHDIFVHVNVLFNTRLELIAEPACEKLANRYT